MSAWANLGSKGYGTPGAPKNDATFFHRVIEIDARCTSWHQHNSMKSHHSGGWFHQRQHAPAKVKKHLGDAPGASSKATVLSSNSMHDSLPGNGLLSEKTNSTTVEKTSPEILCCSRYFEPGTFYWINLICWRQEGTCVQSQDIHAKLLAVQMSPSKSPRNTQRFQSTGPAAALAMSSKELPWIHPKLQKFSCANLQTSLWLLPLSADGCATAWGENGRR